jgi:AcrR family transcriptional regulator
LVQPVPPRRPLESVARPKQARSAETLARILDAAEALIADKGLADASIPEIVRRAHSSVGGFYARFKDKNELLRALEERFFLEMVEKLDALAEPGQWERAGVPEIVAACVAELVGTVRERHNLLAAFLSRAAGDPEFILHGVRFRRRVASRIGELLLRRRDQIGHPEPEVGIDIGVQFAFGLMLQSIVLGDLSAGGRTLSDEELEREITRSFVAYIGAAPK